MTAPTHDELFDAGKATIQGERPELVVNEGDVSEMMLAASTAQSDYVVGYTASRVQATFLDGSTGADLTKLADDHWLVARKAATRAEGTVSITRAVNGPAGTIPAGTAIATVRDALGVEIQVQTTVDSTWTLNEQTTKVVNARAVLAGTSGNVEAGKLTRIIDTLFDSAFTVTNAAKFAGGNEEESDEDLRERVRTVPLTLRRGTPAALVHGALEVASVHRARAVPEVDNSGVKTGIVNLYIFDASGNSNAQMVEDVEEEIVNWACAGDTVNVIGGVLQTVAGIDLDMVMRDGYTLNETQSQQIKEAIVASAARLEAGETWSLNAIRAAALSVDLDAFLDVVVISPAAPVAATGPQYTIRTVIGNITVGEA